MSYFRVIVFMALMFHLNDLIYWKMKKVNSFHVNKSLLHLLQNNSYIFSNHRKWRVPFANEALQKQADHV
jgi:hypothetical protein